MMKKLNYKNIYIIGIEGNGTSALASMYKKMGVNVSGSDDGDHFYQKMLNDSGIETFEKYDKENIPENVDLVVHSTVVREDNPELIEAKAGELKVLSYPEALAELFNAKDGIAVSGTHGKTTTAAMLATAMKKLGSSPSAIVGSKVIEWNGNSIAGDSNYFIIEADEYQNKLRFYNPQHAILTSVDYDHPDFFENFDVYKDAFRDFVKRIPVTGILVYCNDSRDVIDVSKDAKCHKVSYGFTEGSDYQIDIKKGKKLKVFEVIHSGESLGVFEIKFPGKHNMLNATSVIALCNELGLESFLAGKFLSSFEGTARRFERVGQRDGAILIDDYAHHPEAIVTTLKTLRDIYADKNIITVFHPHSFSRTEALLSEFSQSFENTDQLIVLDIYGSREESGNVSSRDLVGLVNTYDRGKATNISTVDEVVEMLKNRIDDNDIVISMGAGDVWRVTHKLAGKI
ncbi:UDP-N-acetylmuramate--L-alanine ligase [Patescibacteria group bacterium]